jgi:hypothetical protein
VRWTDWIVVQQVSALGARSRLGSNSAINGNIPVSTGVRGFDATGFAAIKGSQHRGRHRRDRRPR